jgi:hypothetical protein
MIPAPYWTGLDWDHVATGRFAAVELLFIYAYHVAMFASEVSTFWSRRGMAILVIEI